jgi:hypothetical protein
LKPLTPCMPSRDPHHSAHHEPLLMGHERSRHGELEGGSRIGARFRHTTPEMAVRVAAAVQERLVIVVQIAEAVLELDHSGGRVF